MLKIYNAIGKNNTLVLKKGIELKNRRFNTEKKGYGTIISTRNCQMADYLVDDLKDFKKQATEIERSGHGIKNNPFSLRNLYSKEELDVFQCMGKLPADLNEEGILLFTDDVILSYYTDRKIEKVIGRYKNTGAYILLPGAKLGINSLGYRENLEEVNVYEVLESTSKPKQLYLTKTDRRIVQ